MRAARPRYKCQAGFFAAFFATPGFDIRWMGVVEMECEWEGTGKRKRNLSRVKFLPLQIQEDTFEKNDLTILCDKTIMKSRLESAGHWTKKCPGESPYLPDTFSFDESS